MLYAWTFNWILLNDKMKPDVGEYTMNYLISLLKQLTSRQALYSEICFRDPLG